MQFFLRLLFQCSAFLAVVSPAILGCNLATTSRATGEAKEAQLSADQLNFYAQNGYVMFETQDDIQSHVVQTIAEAEQEIFASFPGNRRNLLRSYFRSEWENTQSRSSMEYLRRNALRALRGTPSEGDERAANLKALADFQESLDGKNANTTIMRNIMKSPEHSDQGALVSALGLVHDYHRKAMQDIADGLEGDTFELVPDSTAFLIDRKVTGRAHTHSDPGFGACASNHGGPGTKFIRVLEAEDIEALNNLLGRQDTWDALDALGSNLRSKVDQLFVTVDRAPLTSWEQIPSDGELRTWFADKLFPSWSDDAIELEAGWTICFQLDDTLWGGDSLGFLHTRPANVSLETFRAATFTFFSRDRDVSECGSPPQSS